MIVIPNKFIFLATPRTGSRAISEALIRKYPQAISEYPTNHHGQPAETNKLRKYSVVRNPVDQILSWWSHNTVNRHIIIEQTPLEWAQTFDNVMYFARFEKYVLNMHAEITDHFLPYTDDMDVIKKELELDDLEVIGRSRYRDIVTEEQIQEVSDYIDKEFPNDVQLWKDVSNV